MKQDYLEELIEELTKLKNEQENISLPKPPSPISILKVIDTVTQKHKINSDELSAALALRNISSGGISLTEIEYLKELEKTEDEEAQQG